MCGLFVGIAAIAVAALLEVMRRGRPSVPGCGSGGAETSAGSGGGGAGTDAPSPAPSLPADDDTFFAERSDCYSECAFPGVQVLVERSEVGNCYSECAFPGVQVLVEEAK